MASTRCISRPRARVAAGGDLLAGQVGFGEDPAGVGQQAVGGSPHRHGGHQLVTGPGSVRVARGPRPPAPASRAATAGSRRCSRRPGSGWPPRRPARPGIRRSRSRRPAAPGGWRPGTRRTTAHAPQVVVVAGGEVGAPEGQHERGGVDGLLVGARPSACRAACQPALPTSTSRSSSKQTSSRNSSDSRATRRLVAIAGQRVGAEQRQGHQGVVVGQRRLEPAPVVAWSRSR